MRVDDVNARQSLELADVKFAVGCVTLCRLLVETNFVSAHITHGAEFRRLEGSRIGRICLGDIAGTVDFIIHDDHDAFTFCFRRRSNANSFKKVHRTVGRNGCGRAHSADQNHRLVALSNKVQEVSGFFQCIGTVGNHHSVNLRISQQFVNALGKFQQGLGIHIVGRDLDDLFTGNIGIVFHCGNRFDQSLNA